MDSAYNNIVKKIQTQLYDIEIIDDLAKIIIGYFDNSIKCDYCDNIANFFTTLEEMEPECENCGEEYELYVDDHYLCDLKFHDNFYCHDIIMKDNSAVASCTYNHKFCSCGHLGRCRVKYSVTFLDTMKYDDNLSNKCRCYSNTNYNFLLKDDMVCTSCKNIVISKDFLLKKCDLRCPKEKNDWKYISHSLTQNIYVFKKNRLKCAQCSTYLHGNAMFCKI